MPTNHTYTYITQKHIHNTCTNIWLYIMVSSETLTTPYIAARIVRHSPETASDGIDRGSGLMGSVPKRSEHVCEQEV